MRRRRAQWPASRALQGAPHIRRALAGYVGPFVRVVRRGVTVHHGASADARAHRRQIHTLRSEPARVEQIRPTHARRQRNTCGRRVAAPTQEWQSARIYTNARMRLKHSSTGPTASIPTFIPPSLTFLSPMDTRRHPPPTHTHTTPPTHTHLHDVRATNDFEPSYIMHVRRFAALVAPRYAATPLILASVAASRMRAACG